MICANSLIIILHVASIIWKATWNICSYTTVQKFGSVRFPKKKLQLVFSKDALNWSKVTVKTFIMFIMNFQFIKGAWIKWIMVSTKILSSKTVFNIDNNYRNVSWAANHQIRIISEGSCDLNFQHHYSRLQSLIKGINYICMTIYYLNRILQYVW